MKTSIKSFAIGLLIAGLALPAMSEARVMSENTDSQTAQLSQYDTREPIEHGVILQSANKPTITPHSADLHEKTLSSYSPPIVAYGR